MMGVYIKGMEMPKDKAVAVVIHPDGTAYTAEMFAGVCTKYLADCTAVPVPPHGDLIDQSAYRDEFMDGVYDLCNDDPDNYRANSIIDLFDAAPTIIPADGKDIKVPTREEGE